MNNLTSQSIEISPVKTLHQYGPFSFTIGSEGFNHSSSFIIEDLIPSSSFGIAYGPTSTLKSFLAVDIAGSISSGINWGDKAVNKGAVIYIAAEGERAIAQRVKAFELSNNVKVDNLFILGQSLIMSDDDSQMGLVNAIRDIELQHQTNVVLVIIDTLARCYDGDENTSRDMSAFIRGCDTVKALTGATILCIHHSGRDEKKGARGSSALRAACDFEFQVKRSGKSKSLTLINTKQKDSDEAPDMKLDFEPIDLGIKCQRDKSIESLARVNTAVVQDCQQENCPILTILSVKFGGKATCGELKNELFQSKNALTDAERKKYSRDLKRLKEEGLIRVDQANELRISATDIIYVCH
ncbi:TPA: AAA family ATPase [Vibrio parahaemolyticus]|nr:AAA family ATPase [Vibrio parahaemolyticus]